MKVADPGSGWQPFTHTVLPLTCQKVLLSSQNNAWWSALNIVAVVSGADCRHVGPWYSLGWAAAAVQATGDDGPLLGDWVHPPAWQPLVITNLGLQQ